MMLWWVVAAAGAVGLVVVGAGAANAELGDLPSQVTMAPDGTYAYVANAGSNSVSKLRASDNAEIARIPVGNEPAALAISPDGSFVLVANKGSETVSRINTATATVVATIDVSDYGGQVESDPYDVEIAPVGDFAYVAVGDSVVRLSTIHNSVTGAFHLGKVPGTDDYYLPQRMAISDDGSVAYVNGNDRYGHGAAFSVRTSDSYVHIVLATPHALGDVVMTRDTLSAYVFATGDKAVYKVRIADNNVTGPLPGLKGTTMAVSPDGAFGHLLGGATDAVQVVQLWNNTVVSTVPVGGCPQSAAFHPSGTFSYVAVNCTDSVVRLNLPSSPKVGSVTVTATTITINFTAPALNGGPAISNYYYSLDNGTSWIARAPAGTSSPLVITGLQTGVHYQLAVRAATKNGFGVPAMLSTVIPSVPPGPPTALVATPGNGQATIKFSNPANNGGSSIFKYEYSVDGKEWIKTPGDAPTSPVTIPSLVNGTKVAVRLRACNFAGCSTPSASVSVTPAGPPSAPTNLKAVKSDGSVWIAFTLPASNGGQPITRYDYSLDNGATWITPIAISQESPLWIPGLTNGTSYPIKLRAVNVVTPGAASATVNATPSDAPQPTVFVPLAPARVLDTRPTEGGAGPIQAGEQRTVSVKTVQNGIAPVVPPGATAIAYNLTVPAAGASGHVRVVPAKQASTIAPVTPAIYFRPGESIANGLTAKVDVGRRLVLTTDTPVNAIVDVLGYFIAPELAGLPGASGRFTPIAPIRAYDSDLDPGNGLVDKGKDLPAGMTRVVNLAKSQSGVAVVPAGATSVAYNITVVRPDRSGHLRVMPGNVASTNASAINWATKNDVIANGLVVKVDANRAIRVYNGSSGPVRFLVDVLGYYSAAPTGMVFYPIDSARVFDSKSHAGGPLMAVSPLQVGTSKTQAGGMPVVPANAKAMSYNLTVPDSTSSGHMRIYPANAPLTSASALNWPGPGYTRANGSVVALSASQKVSLYNGAGLPTHAYLDVLGYYTSAP